MIPQSLVGCLTLMLRTGHLVPSADQLIQLGAQWLALVPTEGRSLDEWASEVLTMFAATPARHRQRLFWLLDGGAEQGGPVVFGYTRQVQGRAVEWHWKLRKVRNHPSWGPRLFEVLQLQEEPHDLFGWAADPEAQGALAWVLEQLDEG